MLSDFIISEALHFGFSLFTGSIQSLIWKKKNPYALFFLGLLLFFFLTLRPTGLKHSLPMKTIFMGVNLFFTCA